MTCPKYVISPAGEKWIAAKIKAFRAEHMREPNRDEAFSIKQAWRALQIDVQLRKQTRRLHKKICDSENFQWQPSVAPRR
ncbi:hypothetical protein MKW06_001688 [Escherichia coli]|uniref:hypothetical protein n=1 Tax=Leclercia adecarboxylata TaxID=83655 RepID=UPI001CC02A96|nr:hypothetical protein [Leclercia adecarboxylata]EIX6860524.1 hypothetical protein [Escherichia coli]MBZ3802410.1 hypothetical protein [Leclercia adecarboxylata]MBZ3807046.1 hypothetical protein [Leclercia adecarboxylata]